MKLAGSVVLQVAGGVVAFAVIVTAGAWTVHGMVLLIRAIP